MFRVMLLGILVSLGSPVRSEVFTSILDLQQLMLAERDVSHTLKEYIKHERERLDQLEAVADDFEQHSSSALENPDQNLGNLVSSYLNVRRFTSDWEEVVNSLLNSQTSTLLLNQISTKTSVFPCQDDLAQAAKNLFLLQDTYDLTTAQMAKGEVPGVDGRSSLSGKDCFQMGRLAYFKNDYYHTILWVEYAMTQTNNTQELSDMYDYLNFAYYQQGDVAYAAKLAEEWIRIDPTNSRANNNLEHYRLMLQQNKDQAAFVEDQKSEHETKEAARGSSHRPVRRPYTPWTSQQLHHDYEKLCRGEQTEYVNPYQHQLSCAYRRIDPVFTLTPLKEEILHMDPLIRIFHDVLAPSEKKLMKEMAAPRLHRSVVFQSGNDLTETEYRISKTAWIADSEDPGIRQISMKAGTIAGLNLNTVEHLQVLNYGIGGHYEPHYDFSTATDETDFSDNIGNRIATVIFYIEDVEAGGATAFPAVGVRVTPEAGAAGLWYNLHRSGAGDTRTIHGACPVLAGTKWVATKWFHERGQEFVRPCALDPAL